MTTTGSDANPGTAEQPWRTISHAARTAPAGALVDVRAGTYNERVIVEASGASGRPTTFQARPGEKVTISGAGLSAREGQAGLHVEDRSQLEFVGFELRDLADTATRERYTPVGVWITGTASDIALRGLDVHDIRTRRGNAHGIAVYGTSGTTPIRNVTVEGNRVHALVLGASEAIAINGNVAGWEVVGNTIDDTNNIGIDAIGFEGTAPRNDTARDGLIAGNVVSDVDTLGNFAYLEDGENYRCAGGIYVDGGHRITIERNRVTRANLGVELASEHLTGVTSDITLRNNVVTRSDRAGLTMGGYDTKRGKTERVSVLHNTFLDNDRLRQGVGEVELNHRVLHSTFLNNVFRTGRAGLMVTNRFSANRGNVFNGNVWFSPGRSSSNVFWQWRRRDVEGFAAWRRATRGESRGRYRDPRVSAAGVPLPGSPLPGSPLKDAGVPAPLARDVDPARSPRVQGGRIDVGAFETAC